MAKRRVPPHSHGGGLTGPGPDIAGDQSHSTDLLVKYRHRHHCAADGDCHSAGGQSLDDHEGPALEPAAQFRPGTDYPDLDRWFRLAVLPDSDGAREVNPFLTPKIHQVNVTLTHIFSFFQQSEVVMCLCLTHTVTQRVKFLAELS